MTYKRYGTFRFADYWQEWWNIIWFSFAMYIFWCHIQIPDYYVLLPTSMMLLQIGMTLLSILPLHQERFSLTSERISIKKGKRITEITLPKRITLIISPLTVRPFLPLDRRGTPYLMKREYAISILYYLSIEEALQVLHKEDCSSYSAVTIRTSFEANRVLYDFAGNDRLLDTIMCHPDHQLIVPATMKHHLGKRIYSESVYIDESC